MPSGASTNEPLAVDRIKAAELLGCSVGQVVQLTADGRLPSYRIGRLVRIRMVDIHDFMASGGTR